MMRVIWREVSRTESEFYAMNRRVFGEDVYVTKHPTWHTGFRGSEFMHNGLDWWTARRDFAQSDETVPLPCILGMARKTDGRLEALAAGGLESVKMPGFELKLDHPEDVALLRLDDVLRGVWQTNDRTAAVPEALQAVTPDWIRLWSPRP